MNIFTKDQLHELQKVRQFPCISYYLPVQKEGADTRQGPIRLRQLVKATEENLHGKGLRTPQIEKIVKPVEELFDQALFWEHQDATLGLFFNANGLIIHQLPIAVQESVTIADRFMIRPLLPVFEHDGHYHLLTLGLSDTRLYRCTRYSSSELKLTSLPESLKAIFETYSTEKQLQHHSGSSRGRNSSGGSVFHGSESMKDSEKDRIFEYFQQIDASLKKSLPDDQTPLVLVCVDYLYPLFKSVCKDPRLMAAHISGSPDTLKRETILKNGWEIVQPLFMQAKTTALKSCQKLMGTPRVIEDIRQIMPAASQKQIEYLFLSDGKQVWGRSDPLSGHVELLPEDRQPEFGEEELLDLAAMQVIQNGGQVFVLNHPEMPEPSDCVAVLRF